MLENIRVAPSTMLRDMSINPWAVSEVSGGADNDMQAEQVSAGVDDEAPDTSGDAEETWFVTLWSALEDLFDYGAIMTFNDQLDSIQVIPADDDDEEAVHWSGDEEEDVGDLNYMSGNAMSGIQAVKQRLLGGIKSAEKSIFAKHRLDTTDMNKYIECKSKLTTRASFERAHHFSLSSTQWNVLGAVLVKSVLDRAELSTSSDPWNKEVNDAIHSMMANVATAAGSRGEPKYPLDDSELKIICNFFHIGE